MQMNLFSKSFWWPWTQKKQHFFRLNFVIHSIFRHYILELVGEVEVGAVGPKPWGDGDDGGLHDVVVIHTCIQTVKRALVHTSDQHSGYRRTLVWESFQNIDPWHSATIDIWVPTHSPECIFHIEICMMHFSYLFLDVILDVLYSMATLQI